MVRPTTDGEQPAQPTQPPRRLRTIISQTVRRSTSVASFLRRGQSSQDSPRTANAQKRRTEIKQAHRARRKEGATTSPTPSLESIARQLEGGPGPSTPRPPDPSTPRNPLRTLPEHGEDAGDEEDYFDDDFDDDMDYFICPTCGLARDWAFKDPFTEFCVYCAHLGRDTTEFQTCLRCLRSLARRANFYDEDGNEYSDCHTCRRAIKPRRIPV